MSFNGEIADLQCSICLQQFHDPIILNCGHTFDRSCIAKMLNANKSSRSIRPIKCPLCNCTFNPETPLISNKSLVHVLQCAPTFEWYLIDISSPKERLNALTFLKHVFNRRDIFDTNHITFATGDIRMTIDSDTNFEQELQIKPLSNLENTLHEICIYLQNRDGIRKICILTDGFTKHCNVTKVDSNIINQRLIIHTGHKNQSRTRELADKIDFRFGYFNEKTLEICVQHFLTNFS